MVKKIEKLRKAVRAAAKGKRISCPRARRIAEEHGVPATAVGRICNEEKIKIRRCALGCF